MLLIASSSVLRFASSQILLLAFCVACGSSSGYRSAQKRRERQHTARAHFTGTLTLTAVSLPFFALSQFMNCPRHSRRGRVFVLFCVCVVISTHAASCVFATVIEGSLNPHVTPIVCARASAVSLSVSSDV